MFFAAKSTNFNPSQETFKVNDIARISGKLDMNCGFFYLKHVFEIVSLFVTVSRNKEKRLTKPKYQLRDAKHN